MWVSAKSKCTASLNSCHRNLEALGCSKYCFRKRLKLSVEPTNVLLSPKKILNFCTKRFVLPPSRRLWTYSDRIKVDITLGSCGGIAELCFEVCDSVWCQQSTKYCGRDWKQECITPICLAAKVLTRFKGCSLMLNNT